MDVQLHVSHWQFFIEDVARVSNRYEGLEKTKPMYGLWTSTYDPAQHTSAWVQYANSQRWIYPPSRCSWWLLTPDPTVRVFEIASRADRIRLYEGYGHRGKLDFETMSQRYDALHLAHSCMTDQDSLLVQEWSCESTLWFRWRFKKVERIAPSQQVA